MRFARRFIAWSAGLGLVVAPAVVFAAEGDGFADVPPDAYFADAVAKIFAAGVTAGCASGMYCPDDPVTRGQMAVFLDRVLGDPAPIVDADLLDGRDASEFIAVGTPLDAATLEGHTSADFVPAGELHLSGIDWQVKNNEERFMSLAALPEGATIVSVRVRALDKDGAAASEDLALIAAPVDLGSPFPKSFLVVSLVPPGGFGPGLSEYTVDVATLQAAGFPTTVNRDEAVWAIAGADPLSGERVNVADLTIFYTVP